MDPGNIREVTCRVKRVACGETRDWRIGAVRSIWRWPCVTGSPRAVKLSGRGADKGVGSKVGEGEGMVG